LGWDGISLGVFLDLDRKDQTIFAASLGGIRFETVILNKEVHGTVYKEERESERERMIAII
jgi:hypothetical protein